MLCSSRALVHAATCSIFKKAAPPLHGAWCVRECRWHCLTIAEEAGRAEHGMNAGAAQAHKAQYFVCTSMSRGVRPLATTVWMAIKGWEEFASAHLCVTTKRARKAKAVAGIIIKPCHSGQERHAHHLLTQSFRSCPTSPCSLVVTSGNPACTASRHSERPGAAAHVKISSDMLEILLGNPECPNAPVTPP
jgi:hypothetical protein